MIYSHWEKPPSPGALMSCAHCHAPALYQVDRINSNNIGFSQCASSVCPSCGAIMTNENGFVPQGVCSTGVIGEKTIDGTCVLASICAGDIVLVSYEGENLFEGLVEFRDGAWVINTNSDILPIYNILNPPTKYNKKLYTLTITGNKWDNPELYKAIFDEN